MLFEMYDDEIESGSGKIGMINRDNLESKDLLDKRATKIVKRRNNI